MEQKADSVYYMGFIFTLVAMTASLVALANSDELLFNTVVANFGLALGTTILGLTVRIIWLQMNSQALEDADAILRDKLIKMSQALYDNNERIVSAMTALSSQMEDVTEPIKENYLKLARSFDISDQINTKLSDLNINLELASENVQDLASKLEELNPEFNDLNKNAKEAIKVPSFIVAELTQLKGQAATLVEKTQDLALAAERIDEEASEATKTTILGLEMSLRNFDQAILQANELMDLNAQHIQDHLSNSKSALEKSLTQADELMDANAQHIEDHLSNSKSALEDSNKLLIDGAELIKDGNRAISKALQQSARQIEESMNLAEEMEEANEGSQETKD
jgi:galactitol-specific phosphotransferase system IIB component